MSLTDANRLTFDDALFETMGRALATPVITQTVWRFPTPLDRGALELFHARLARGPLDRMLVRARTPGARDRWTPGGGSGAGPLLLDHDLDAVAPWLAAHARTPIDPTTGPTWSLAYATFRGGTSALSFVTSHVVADGGLKLLALEAAATGADLPVLPLDAVAGLPVTLRDDLADALRQLGAAARALPSLVRRPRSGGVPGKPDDAQPGQPGQPDQRAAPLPRSAGDDAEPWTPPVVILDGDHADWERRAAADGGSVNSLVLAVCAELAAATGRVGPGDTLTVASPVSTRGERDLRSNASTGVGIPVMLEADGAVASLAAVRAAAREAYAALGDETRPDPLAAARALLPLLPDGLIRRLAPRWPAPLVLASNLGTLSDALLCPAGRRATSALNRSITPPTTRGAARRTGAGLSAWWTSTGETATFCVAGADPDAFPDVGTLREHAERVLRRRGLAPTSW